MGVNTEKLPTSYSKKTEKTYRYQQAKAFPIIPSLRWVTGLVEVVVENCNLKNYCFFFYGFCHNLYTDYDLI